MLLYVIRHGETNLNINHIVQGWVDEPLNEKGRELAHVTGRAMRGIHFDRCISSPLSRAVETAEIVLKESGNLDIDADSLCGAGDYPESDYGARKSSNSLCGAGDYPESDYGASKSSDSLCGAGDSIEAFSKSNRRNRIQIEIDERIKEMHFGTSEGLKITDDIKHRFFTDPFKYGKFPEGESVQDVCTRTREFLDELIALDDDKTYLISTHGCAMRALLNQLYDDPSDYWQGHVPFNCEVNIIEAKNGVAKILEANKIYYDPEQIVDHFVQ